MTTFTHGDAQDMLAALKQGWERRLPDEILELFDSNIEYRPDPFSEPLIGHNAVRTLWNDMAAEQTHVEFDAERIWVTGSTVLASWHAAYTRQQTSERVRVRGFMTLEIGDDHRVVRFRQWPLERVVGTDTTVRVQGRAD